MRSIDWEQIRLPVDRMPLNIHKTNIRGVECDTIVQPKCNGKSTENLAKLYNDQTNNELNTAIETLIKHLPAVNVTNSDSDMKVIKLPRLNGSNQNVMILVW